MVPKQWPSAFSVPASALGGSIFSNPEPNSEPEEWVPKLAPSDTNQSCTGPQLEPVFGFAFRRPSQCFGAALKKPAGQAIPEVTVYLQWLQYLNTTGFSTQDAIWVNMDETAVPLVVTHRVGNVYRFTRAAPPQAPAKARMQMRRGHCTVAATATCETDLQPFMPQFVLPNTKGKKKLWRDHPSVQAPPASIQVQQEAAGWMTTAILVELAKTTVKRIREQRPGAKIVFVCDCHPTHLSHQFLRHSRRVGMKTLLIPSKLLTYLLQVLDVAVFAKYKAHLQDVLTRAAAASSTG